MTNTLEQPTIQPTYVHVLSLPAPRSWTPEGSNRTVDLYALEIQGGYDDAVRIKVSRAVYEKVRAVGPSSDWMVRFGFRPAWGKNGTLEPVLLDLVHVN